MDKPLDQRILNRIVFFGIAGWIGIIACAISYSVVTSRDRFDGERLRQVAEARKAALSPTTSLRIRESAMPQPPRESSN